VKTFITITLFLITLTACSKKNNTADAYGNFEAVETLIAAEAGGKLLFFDVEEGVTLSEQQRVGCIDTTQLALKRIQLVASKQSVDARSANVLAQMEVLQEQRRVAMTEKTRIENLYREKVATQKQMDDITGQVRVIEKQIASTEAQNAGVLSELAGLDAQIRQINDQIQKSLIINPISGTVLAKYVQSYEIVSFGKPLYKIADIRVMHLRAYISGDQLSHVKIGQKVRVAIDDNATDNRSLEGEVIWIASKAEFTPKIIQTKEERVNMVYAIKVKVQNDGSLKIGMPGEMYFQ